METLVKIFDRITNFVLVIAMIGLGLMGLGEHVDGYVWPNFACWAGAFTIGRILYRMGWFADKLGDDDETV